MLSNGLEPTSRSFQFGRYKAEIYGFLGRGGCDFKIRSYKCPAPNLEVMNIRKMVRFKNHFWVALGSGSSLREATNRRR